MIYDLTFRNIDLDMFRRRTLLQGNESFYHSLLHEMELANEVPEDIETITIWQEERWWQIGDDLDVIPVMDNWCIWTKKSTYWDDMKGGVFRNDRDEDPFVPGFKQSRKIDEFKEKYDAIVDDALRKYSI